jgi:hypothetical protein
MVDTLAKNWNLAVINRKGKAGVSGLPFFSHRYARGLSA